MCLGENNTISGLFRINSKMLHGYITYGVNQVSINHTWHQSQSRFDRIRHINYDGTCEDIVSINHALFGASTLTNTELPI